MLFKFKLFKQSTCVLHPVNTINTSPLRFTATAGTKLVRAYSSLKIIIFKLTKKIYNP